MKDNKKVETQNNSTGNNVSRKSNNTNIIINREEQKKEASKYLNKPLKLGDKWYLINSDWYTKWANFICLPLTNYNDTENTLSNLVSPDKINNKTLLTNDNQLKLNIIEEIDFYTICEELWNYLVRIYGTTSQQEDTIERYVIDDGIDGESSFKIEIRPVKVYYTLANQTSIFSEEMSRSTMLDKLIDRLKTVFKLVPDKQVRVYFKSKDLFGQSKYQSVEIDNKTTLNTSGYGPNEIIFLDVQNENGDWSIELPSEKSNENITKLSHIPTPPPLPPPPPLSTSTIQNHKKTTLPQSTHHSNTRPAFNHRHTVNDCCPGLCGLSNLGNTCFMNSAIQCMSNVPPLTDFFLSDEYKKAINITNPLGRKGELAEAYAELIKEMWSGNNSSTRPHNFKLNLSRFAPQFSGFQQQDSQELLAFLLDGLNEDLNRIKTKHRCELGSHNGKTDEQFAQESLIYYKKQTDSIINDLFQGLFKSTLNCLICKETSIKFDPFTNLSVPLPFAKERFVEVYFVSLNKNVPLTKYKLTVPKNGNISDLCASLEQIIQIPKQNIVVCDVFSCKFFKEYESTDLLTNIRERDDIYAYELVTSSTNSDYLRVQLHLKEKNAYQYSSSFFGLPLYLMVPKHKLKYKILYQAILNQLKLFIKDSSVLTIDEINSKLNDYLKENNQNNESNGDESNDEFNTEKLFKLIVCKNDNSNYDNIPQHILLNNDDTLIDLKSLMNSPQTNTLSLIAEFEPNFSKNFLSKNDYIKHASCNNRERSKKKDSVQLSECFNLYTTKEDLSENDYWYCSNCKKNQPSTKKIDFWSLPIVMVIHLKRFSFTRYYRDKIDTLVDFPLTDLDMSNYLINKNVNKITKYNLIAISNHFGSLGGGHYTAYAQNRYDGKWYNFDDSLVSLMDENNICTSAAYLLVYLRQDFYDKHIKKNTESENEQQE